jgi:hypothetical protein
MSSALRSALIWRKSSFSESGNCVEVAALPDEKVGIRDSRDKNENGLILTFTPDEWRAFLSGVKHGEFDGI